MASSFSISLPQASWRGVIQTGSIELSMSGVSALRPRSTTAEAEPISSIMVDWRPDRPSWIRKAHVDARALLLNGKRHVGA
jgi:hypothetical protein